MGIGDLPGIAAALGALSHDYYFTPADLKKPEIQAFLKATGLEEGGLQARQRSLGIRADNKFGPQAAFYALNGWQEPPPGWQTDIIKTFGNAWYPHDGRTDKQVAENFAAGVRKFLETARGCTFYGRYGRPLNPVALERLAAALESGKGPTLTPNGIRAVQEFLHAAGYTHIRLNGKIDRETAHALMEFALMNHPAFKDTEGEALHRFLAIPDQVSAMHPHRFPVRSRRPFFPPSGPRRTV